MHASTIFALLAASSSVLAAPQNRRNVVTEVVHEVVHKTVTAGQAPAPTPVVAAAERPQVQEKVYKNVVVKTITFGGSAPAATPVQKGNSFHGWKGGNSWGQGNTHYDQQEEQEEEAPAASPSPAPQTPSPTPVVSQPEPTTEASQPAATYSSGEDDSSSSSGSEPIDIINTWDKKFGVDVKQWDETLASNAKQTCEQSSQALDHELLPGSMGQVMAPGSADDFKAAYIMWLCEANTEPELAGVCSGQTKSKNADAPLGHYNILIKDGYKKIGCGFANNIWTCDVA